MDQKELGFLELIIRPLLSFCSLIFLDFHFLQSSTKLFFGLTNEGLTQDLTGPNNLVRRVIALLLAVTTAKC